MKFSFHRPSDKETEEKIARLESRLAIMQATLESHNARLETQLRLALVEQFDKHRDDLLAIINYLGYGIMKRPVFGEPALPESPDLARLHELAMKEGTVGSVGSIGSIGSMDHLATGTTGPIPTPMSSRGPSSATRRRRAMTEMAQEYGLSGPSISDIPEVEQFRDSLGSIGIPLPPKPDPISSSKSQVQSPNPPPPERSTD